MVFTSACLFCDGEEGQKKPHDTSAATITARLSIMASSEDLLSAADFHKKNGKSPMIGP